MKLFLKALTLGVLISVNALASAALPIAVDGQALPTLAPMLERVQKSLVSISSEAEVQLRRRNDPFFDDPFFRRFFDQRRSKQSHNRNLSGTGVVIDAAQGYILTNEHSVSGASKVTVTLADGRKAPAQIVGSDKATDVAIVKIELTELVAIDLGDSDAMRIGDFVVSIGDPLGGQNTVTSGLISALAKSGGLRNYQNFIQSDVGHGPGVLVNLRGQLVGLNISKVVQTAGHTRIGFSTPVNMALKVKDQLIRYGTPQRGYLSVQMQDLTEDLASAFNITENRGAVITGVSQGSSADRAGMQIGDVVVRADQNSINRGADLRTVVGQRFAGESIELMILRNGKEVLVSVPLESSTQITRTGTMIHHRLDGATFNEVDAKQVSTRANNGVMVSKVKPGSTAWNHGVRPNDLIVSANRKAVSSIEDFRKAIADKDVLMLNIVRGNGALFLLLQ